MQRPLDVTVVGILIVLIAAFDLASLFFVSVHRPDLGPGGAALLGAAPEVTRHGVEFLIGVVEFIAGILILSRLEMGRTLYLAIGLIGLVFALFTAPPGQGWVIAAIVFGIFLFVLYQPLSTVWFRGGRLTSYGGVSRF